MRLLVAQEAAGLLRVNTNRLYDLAKRGVVPSVRIGRQVRFEEDSLRVWIASGGSPLLVAGQLSPAATQNPTGISRGK